MDPLTASVVIILGKYAIDKGASLAKEVGPKAVELAGQLFVTVMSRLRESEKTKRYADDYEADPETFEKPVAKALDAEVQADPSFAAELRDLLSRYEAVAATSPASTVIAQTAGDDAVQIGQARDVSVTRGKD